MLVGFWFTLAPQQQTGQVAVGQLEGHRVDNGRQIDDHGKATGDNALQKKGDKQHDH